MSQGGPADQPDQAAAVPEPAPRAPRNRTRSALTAAAFSYGHFALGMLVSFAVTRYVVQQLGSELYGAWLAAAAFLGYAQLADLGATAIYPWLVAEADGARDEARLRRLVGQGPWIGLCSAASYGAVAAGLIWAYPSFVKLAPGAHAALAVPLAAFASVSAAAFLLRWASGAVAGLQDATWSGALSAMQPLVQMVLIVSFTRQGHGVLGLALGASGPLLVASLVALGRLRATRPDLLRLPARPEGRLVREVVRQGSGSWLGSLGWLLASASDLIVLAYLGLSPAVAAYAVTSRLAVTMMNIAWVLPDSANVGLAHLNAERKPERVRAVVATLATANLLLIGGVSCLVLCVNPAFVPLWVGAGLYGGEALNLLFAAHVVVLSAGHALLVPMGVLGYRRAAGGLQLLTSAVQVALAAGLGRRFGPEGVAAAGAIATALLVLPTGAVLLRQIVGLEGLRAIARAALRWAVRWLPVAAACWWAGRTVVPRGGWAGVAAGAALTGAVYLFAMRALFRDLPWGGRLGTLLRRVGVI